PCALMVLEVLAGAAALQESHQEATRLFAAVDAARALTGIVRFKVDEGSFAATIAALRAAMSDDAFAAAWSEGAALSLEEAVAYATRGRGERKRPSSGW